MLCRGKGSYVLTWSMECAGHWELWGADSCEVAWDILLFERTWEREGDVRWRVVLGEINGERSSRK